MSYRIGSFNCHIYGAGANKDEAVIAEIIRKERLDIVALQEIKENFVLKSLILKHLSTFGYTGCADEYVNDYAFLWNTSRVCLAYYEKDGKISRVYEPRIYKGNTA